MGSEMCIRDSLYQLREDPEALVRDRKGAMPRLFVIKNVSDLGGKFTQRRNFVPELAACVSAFYEQVGQHIVPWQAPPPKPKTPIEANGLALAIDESTENSD